MSKANPALLPFTPRNLARVLKVIERNLTPDLLPKKFVEQNSKNPAFGHCHNAAGCLYKIFSSQSLHMYRALDKNGIYHWWVQDRDGNIIDPTATQYSERAVKQLYKHGVKAGILGFVYKQRVNALLDRVRIQLKF